MTTTFVPRRKVSRHQIWFILQAGTFHGARSSRRNARRVFGHACNCWIARDLWPACFGRGYLTFLSRMYGVRKSVAIMSPDNRSRSTAWRIFAGFDRLRGRYVPLRTIKALAKFAHLRDTGGVLCGCPLREPPCSRKVTYETLGNLLLAIF